MWWANHGTFSRECSTVNFHDFDPGWAGMIDIEPWHSAFEFNAIPSVCMVISIGAKTRDPKGTVHINYKHTSMTHN